MEITKIGMINFRPQFSIDAHLKNLDENKYHVIMLDGSKIHDKDSLIDEVSSQVLQGYVGHNLDAFAESLFDYFIDEAHRHKKIALMWTNAEQMSENSLKDLTEALLILSDISRDLYVDDSKILVTFLMGYGANFEKG